MYGLRSAGLNPQGSNVTQFSRQQQAAMAKSAGPYGQFVVVAEDQCKITASKPSCNCGDCKNKFAMIHTPQSQFSVYFAGFEWECTFKKPSIKLEFKGFAQGRLTELHLEVLLCDEKFQPLSGFPLRQMLTAESNVWNGTAGHDIPDFTSKHVQIGSKKSNGKLRVGNHVFHVNKELLSTFSPYFNALFNGDFPEASTLHDLVVKNGKGLPVGEARKYLAQLIDGVRKLHELGLMHRDLKPKNILVAKSHDGILMKIADFGLSKLAMSGSTVCGTPCYMAPEIWKGKHDKAVDVYSLGCIYYFMFSGTDPYFKFDKCGYPIYPNKPREYGHRCLTGRMMCQRKVERLSLDQIKFENDGYTLSRGSCAKCGLYLFYASKSEKDALYDSMFKKSLVSCGAMIATFGLGLAIPASPILASIPLVVGTVSWCSALRDGNKLERHENTDIVTKAMESFDRTHEMIGLCQDFR